MKDAYYSCLPMVPMDPSLAPAIIRWFSEHGVRPKGTLVEGGLNHSLSLSVAGVVLAGLYYERSGDRAFFVAHPELKRGWDDLLEEVIASRAEGDTWLFRSRYISDGALEGDYHTGSNVVAWRALTAWSRLLGGGLRRHVARPAVRRDRGESPCRPPRHDRDRRPVRPPVHRGRGQVGQAAAHDQRRRRVRHDADALLRVPALGRRGLPPLHAFRHVGAQRGLSAQGPRHHLGRPAGNTPSRIESPPRRPGT